MYHCEIQFYFFCCQSGLIDSIEGIEPLDNFSHTFFQSDKIEPQQASRADIIVADLQHVDVNITLRTLIACKKKGASVIVLIEKKQIAQITERQMKDVSDIWMIPMTTREMKFRFAKWQENFKTQKDLWLAQNYLDSTINSVPHLVWYKDKAGAHLKVNQSFCEAVNKTMEQVQGRGHYYIWDLTPDEYASGEYVCMESEFEVMDKRETCVFDEQVKIHNEIRQLKTYKSPLFDLDGSVMGTVGVATDVTQERMYEQMIQNNANTDFLTGLYNRRYVSNFIEEAEGESLVAYYLDLDNFKSVNDQYGHKEGDEALQLTAEVLKELMPEATIARMGGDEFLVIEKTENSDAEIEEKRIRLQEQLDQAYRQREHLQNISVSVGTAHAEGGKEATDKLINEADEFMYREKSKKPNRR
jgi:diguanylate cyclase (GGDEF)-like protein/PAS domain S-box-containing protein